MQKKVTDYSQHGEYAEWIAPYFEAHPPRHIYLVDVGAKGPHNSNSWDLLVAGWRGLLIEPHQGSFAQLVRTCRVVGIEDVSIVDCALADYDGEGVLYEHSTIGHSSLSENWKPESAMGVETAVRVCQPSTLFNDFDVPADFDFLTVDAEGYDWIVVEAIFVAGYLPSLVVVEWPGAWRSVMEAHIYFRHKGYGLIDSNKVNAAFARKDIEPCKK